MRLRYHALLLHLLLMSELNHTRFMNNFSFSCGFNRSPPFRYVHTRDVHKNTLGGTLGGPVWKCTGKLHLTQMFQLCLINLSRFQCLATANCTLCAPYCSPSAVEGNSIGQFTIYRITRDLGMSAFWSAHGHSDRHLLTPRRSVCGHRTLLACQDNY